MVDTRIPKIIVSVRFRSRLSKDELQRVYKERLPEFRELPGLIQKYYAYDESKDEWCGVYLWGSAESLEAYMGSELRKSIASAYEVDGAPRLEKVEVFDTLR